MMSHSDDRIEEAMTLDPPGRIAVVGAGALGIEAALYGRYLGYQVTLVEAVAVGQSMRDRQQEPLPMLPDRCLSPLAVSALRAQRAGAQREGAQREGAQGDAKQPLPTTFGEWIEDALVPLTESDLLSGRLRIPKRVTEIVQIAVPGDADEDTSDIPPDFRLTLRSNEGPTESVDCEAVILAVGASCDIRLGFAPPIPYFWRIGANFTADAEYDLLRGFREIVDLFAELAGRADLDLYRPRRV